MKRKTYRWFGRAVLALLFVLTTAPAATIASTDMPTERESKTVSVVAMDQHEHHAMEGGNDATGHDHDEDPDCCGDGPCLGACEQCESVSPVAVPAKATLSLGSPDSHAPQRASPALPKLVLERLRPPI